MTFCETEKERAKFLVQIPKTFCYYCSHYVVHKHTQNIIKIKDNKRFLRDWRTERKMRIGSIDMRFSTKQQRREEKVKREEARRKKENRQSV